MASVSIRGMGGCNSVTVTKRGYAPACVPAVEAGKLYRVSLSEGGSLKVKVVKDSSTPVKGLKLALGTCPGALRAAPAAGDSMSAWSRSGPLLTVAVTGSDGVANFSGLSDGMYQMRAVDSTQTFSPESLEIMSHVTIPSEMLTLEVDDPWIAAWCYRDDSVVDASYRLEVIGGRLYGPIEHAIRARHPGAWVVVVSGVNPKMPALAVEVLTGKGLHLKHAVEFVRQSEFTEPKEMTSSSLHSLSQGSAAVKVTVDRDHLTEDMLELYLERVSDGSEVGELRRIKVGIRDVKRVPCGTYKLKSSLGVLLDEPQFEVLRGHEPTEIACRLRDDVLWLGVVCKSVSGRPVYADGVLKQRGGEAAEGRVRRPLRFSVSSEKVRFLVLDSGDYDLVIRGMGLAEVRRAVSVGPGDFGRLRAEEVLVDDS